VIENILTPFVFFILTLFNEEPFLTLMLSTIYTNYTTCIQVCLWNHDQIYFLEPTSPE